MPSWMTVVTFPCFIIPMHQLYLTLQRDDLSMQRVCSSDPSDRLLCQLTMCTQHIYQYIKIFVVCVSVCDGCGRGSNEFAGRVQNYRVPCAKLSRAFQLSQNFLEM